jgi:hypothetical protein
MQNQLSYIGILAPGRDHGGSEPFEIHAGTGLAQFFGTEGCFSWARSPPKRMLTDHSLRALPAWQVSEHVPLDGNSHEILEVHL